MENFTEFIKERLLSLPPEIQKAFGETDIVGEIEKIRVKFGLMYDQASVLESETMIVFLGLEEPKYLLRNIVQNAKISTEIASQIVEEIEKNILKQIKSRLVEILEEEDVESKKKEEKESLIFDTKDSILQEIENPTPIFKPVTEKIQAKNILPEIAPTQTLTEYTPPILPKKSIIEQKLTEPTRIPPKEIELSIRKIPQTQITPETLQKKYTIDPYKEPIV